MRRRRKTKYTWLPADGQDITVDTTSINSVYFTVSNVINAGAGSALPSTVFTNVLADFPETDVDTAAVSLADEIGSEYFLKRIVGKCFQECFVNGDSGQADVALLRSDFPTVISTVGFFIAPTDPTDAGQPFGSNADFQRYNPGNTIAIRQPWIWRRSWVYSPIGEVPGINNSTTFGHSEDRISLESGGVIGKGSFPGNNARYGSVADGPHIDAKTARRVQKHERLWAASNIQLIPEGDTLDSHFTSVTVNMVFDLRCLGALRRAKNRSNFT